MLQEWAQALPHGLRRQPGTAYQAEEPSITKEITIGNIHVACTYYFGVILVTRQFLIQHIMPQLRLAVSTEEPWPGHGRSPLSTDGDETEDLARLCTDAATYMAQMCSEAADSGYLLRNMCILK